MSSKLKAKSKRYKRQTNSADEHYSNADDIEIKDIKDPDFIHEMNLFVK